MFEYIINTQKYIHTCGCACIFIIKHTYTQYIMHILCAHTMSVYMYVYKNITHTHLYVHLYTRKNIMYV